MWIITKYSGVINSNRVIRFAEGNNGTYAYFQGAAHLISTEPVVANIIEALKNHADFLEVD